MKFRARRSKRNEEVKEEVKTSEVETKEEEVKTSEEEVKEDSEKKPEKTEKKRIRNKWLNKAPVDPTRRFLPNGYGIDVIITNKNNIPDAILRELKQHPAQYGDFPFYCCKRFYMKTICNMINDITDIAVYRGNHSFFETGDIVSIKGDTSREGVRLFLFNGSKDLLKAYEAFETAADRRTQGIKSVTDEDKYALTCEGELVTWIANKESRDELYELDKEYTIIEKQQLDKVVDWFTTLIEMAPPTIHQFAAISYLEGVVAGRYFYDKPVFEYSK